MYLKKSKSILELVEILLCKEVQYFLIFYFLFYIYIFICFLQVRFSSKITCKNLTSYSLFIIDLLIFISGYYKRNIVSLTKLVKKYIFGLPVFSESLFALNHSCMFMSSWLTIWNNAFMSWLEKNRFVSSANIIGFNILDALLRSLNINKKK